MRKRILDKPRTVAVNLDAYALNVIDAMADVEGRSRSSMLRKIIEDYIKTAEVKYNGNKKG